MSGTRLSFWRSACAARLPVPGVPSNFLFAVLSQRVRKHSWVAIRVTLVLLKRSQLVLGQVAYTLIMVLSKRLGKLTFKRVDAGQLRYPRDVFHCLVFYCATKFFIEPNKSGLDSQTSLPPSHGNNLLLQNVVKFWSGKIVAKSLFQTNWQAINR